MLSNYLQPLLKKFQAERRIGLQANMWVDIYLKPYLHVHNIDLIGVF